jgi:hypothetical protein
MSKFVGLAYRLGGGSTVVELLTHNSVIEGSNPAARPGSKNKEFYHRDLW